jgi:hypothetical protein
LQVRTGDRVAYICDFIGALNFDFNFVLLFFHLKIVSILTFVAALDGPELALALKLRWLKDLSVNLVVSIPECNTLA